jgi:multidrug resistance efflux pump
MKSMTQSRPATDDPLTMRDRVARLRLPDKVDAPTSGNRVGWLPWALCVLLAVSCVSILLRGGGRTPVAEIPVAKQPTNGKAAAPVPAAEAKSAAPAAGETVLEWKGYIIPAHQIQVSPIEVAGRITKLFVEEGKQFKAGEVLAELDRSSYEAEFQEAEANVQLAKVRLEELRNGSRPEEIALAYAELKETEESLKQAKLDYERNKHLLTGALSAKEFEAAQYAYTSLLQRVEKLRKTYELVRIGPRIERINAAEAELQLAEARLKRAKWRLDNCTIRAPVSGTILKKSAEIGNLVSPLSFNVSASICEMADLSDLEVELDITERDISKIIVGQPCRIRAEAYPSRQYEGVVDRVMPIANRAKGAVPVRVRINVPPEEEGKYLKPEMGAIVTFLAPEPAKTP